MKPGKATRKDTKEPIVVCISGMAGSGKSTLARRLAQEYGLQYYSGGDALKALAMEQGYKPIDRGWWESKEGMGFTEKRRKDSKFDRAVDEKLLEFAENGNAVLDSWTMPWLFKRGFKIWLEASVQKRAGRVAKRDRIGLDEALAALEEKESQTRTIYERLYGFRLGDDFVPFNFILDTDHLTAMEVFQILCSVMDNVVFKP